MEKILKFNTRFLILYFIGIAIFSLTLNSIRPNTNSQEVKKTTEVVKKKSNETSEENFVSKQNVTSPERLEPASNSQEITEPTPTSPVDELANHNKITDCWIYYQGHLYDITGYFGKHPGGDAIMAKYCGTNATNGFDTKEMGLPHSQSAYALLSNFLIE